MGACCGCPCKGQKELNDKHSVSPEWVGYLNSLSMEGKNVAVTGSTTGLGLHFALEMARLNVKNIFMLNRPSDRARTAQQKVQDEARAKGSRTVVTHIDCDLMSFGHVKSAVSTIEEFLVEEGMQNLTSSEDAHLDVLYLNAGVHGFTPQVNTEDGFDQQIQTGYLAQMLLMSELFPLLEKGGNKHGNARVIFSTSGGRLHVKGKFGGKQNIPFPPPEAFVKNCDTWKRTPYKKGDVRYGLRTALCMLAMYAMHEKLRHRSSNVIAVCSNPGMVSTPVFHKPKNHPDMTNNVNGCMLCCWGCSLNMMGQSESDGAMASVLLAADPKVKSGEFYSPAGEKPLTTGTQQSRGTPITVKLSDWETQLLLHADDLWKATFKCLEKPRFLMNLED